MREPAPTVYVVDDDPDVLKAIERLLESIGLNVATFASPHQFLDSYDRNAPGCLVLDLALPGLNGLEVQRALEQQASVLPIVFLTGRGDIAASVQAMKHGAADFLTKPVDDTALIAAIREALARDQVLRPAQRGARAHREMPCVAHRARTAGSRADRCRKAEQADRRRAGHDREDDQVPSRQPDAQDGCACRRRSGEAGRTRRRRFDART